MGGYPAFGIIPGMPDEGVLQEYRPVSTSRRGELSGWMLVLLCGFAWWVVSRQGSSLAAFIIIFLILFLIVAAGTSLSNWMERHSVLRISSTGIDFTNGLRKVSLTWEQIEEVQVLPSRWGKSVHVIGTEGHFHFQLGVKVELIGREIDRVGFPDGEKILGELFRNTDLKQVEMDRPGRFFVRRES